MKPMFITLIPNTLLLIAGLYFSLAPILRGPDPIQHYQLDSPYGPVEIQWDANGVPQISAETINGIYFGSGWAQARDRLFFMDLMRRMGHNTLPELLGPFGWNDQYVERSGLPLQLDIDEQLGKENPGLSAFSEGINARVENHGESFEYLWLFASFEPWKPIDSLAVFKFMCLMNSTPERPNRFSPWGSNGWALGGELLGSGRAILASDPHLMIGTQPSTWYVQKLVQGSVTVFGASATGLPYPSVGTNGTTAWAPAASGPASKKTVQLYQDPTEVIENGKTLQISIGESVYFGGLPDFIEHYEGNLVPGLVSYSQFSGLHTSLDELAQCDFLFSTESLEETLGILTGFDSSFHWIAADSKGMVGHRYALGPEFMEEPLQASNESWVVTANDSFYLEELPENFPQYSESYIFGEKVNRGSTVIRTRAARIRQLIEEASTKPIPKEHLTTSLMEDWQYDDFDLYSLALKPYMLRALAAAQEESWARRIEAWDGHGASDPEASALAHLWAGKFGHRLSNYSESNPQVLNNYAFVTMDKSIGIADLVEETGSLVQRFEKSERKQILTISHPMAAIPVITNFFPYLIASKDEVLGSYWTLNSSDASPLQNEGYNNWGPSLRMIMEIDGQGPTVHWQLPSGNSGHPLSPHFRNSAENYHNGSYFVEKF